MSEAIYIPKPFTIENYCISSRRPLRAVAPQQRGGRAGEHVHLA